MALPGEGATPPNPKKIRIVLRDDDRARVVVDCPRSTTGECAFSCWQKSAQGAMWHWNGNEASPSISPSINCHVCGRHFTITNGVAA